ncbi:MAG: hypothetical protein Q7N50_01950 [Armatimonadota bacterium]|nr:hypothetical protein [Armatimonadota bacterium]
MQNEQNELAKLDAIRSRANVSYEEAKRALDQSGGDVIKALTELERGGYDIISLSAELLDEAQKLLGAPSATKLRVKFSGKLVKEIPLALTATAAFILGMAAVLITKASLEIERGQDLETQEQ